MTDGMIKGKQNILDFLFGGKAKFTLKSLKTGKSISYRTKVRNGYIAVHTLDKDIYLGALTRHPELGMKFKPATQYSTDATWAFEWFSRHFDEYNQIEIWHHGACSICGRALTDPKSIERGIGPKCYEVLQTGELPF